MKLRRELALAGGVTAMIVGSVFLLKSPPTSPTTVEAPKRTRTEVEQKTTFANILKEEQVKHEQVREQAHGENRENLQNKPQAYTPQTHTYINPILQARHENQILREKRMQELKPYLDAKMAYTKAKTEWTSSWYQRLENTPKGTPQYGEQFLKYVEEIGKLSKLESEFERAIRLGNMQEAKRLALEIKTVVGVEPPIPPKKPEEKRIKNG